MFLLKQFVKEFILPPTPWLMLLAVAVLFWPRRWARKLLLCTLGLVVLLHSGLVSHWARYPLESRYPPLRRASDAGEPYDAIVVLTGGIIPASGLIPFPTLSESMFRRLDEAWRLYRQNPKPIIVSGGHVNPLTAPRNENKIARDYLIAWGVAANQVLGEDRSRDTFESAIEVGKLLRAKGWKRYLLVTSALHMPRSLLVFRARAPEPIPAPGDFSLGRLEVTPLDWFPSESAAERMVSAIHEYVGLVNYHWRLRFSGRQD